MNTLEMKQIYINDYKILKKIDSIILKIKEIIKNKKETDNKKMKKILKIIN